MKTVPFITKKGFLQVISVERKSEEQDIFFFLGCTMQKVKQKRMRWELSFLCKEKRKLQGTVHGLRLWCRLSIRLSIHARPIPLEMWFLGILGNFKQLSFFQKKTFFPKKYCSLFFCFNFFDFCFLSFLDISCQYFNLLLIVLPFLDVYTQLWMKQGAQCYQAFQFWIFLRWPKMFECHRKEAFSTIHARIPIDNFDNFNEITLCQHCQLRCNSRIYRSGRSRLLGHQDGGTKTWIHVFCFHLLFSAFCKLYFSLSPKDSHICHCFIESENFYKCSFLSPFFHCF